MKHFKAYVLVASVLILLSVARADVFRGRVVDAKNHPIANAEILVQATQKDQPEFAYSTLHTDAQGQFSAKLTPSSYSADYYGRIYAVAPGMAPNLVNATTLNRDKESTIQLLPAEAVSGRVVDEKGKPLANIAVQLDGISIKSTFQNVYLSGTPWAKRYQAITDKNGHWQISGVPSGVNASISKRFGSIFGALQTRRQLRNAAKRLGRQRQKSTNAMAGSS